MTDIIPEFVDRAAAAKLCAISVDTWDLWVRDGYVPQPSIRKGQVVRWHWPTVRKAFLASSEPVQAVDDPFIAGLSHVR